MLAGLFLLGALLGGQSEVDPLAPARQGKIRCVAPDKVAKRCSAIIRYTLHDDGSYDAVVTGVVAREPQVMIEYSISGRVEDDAVCAPVRMGDFAAGKLIRDGAPLAAAPETALRAQIMGRLQPLVGKKRCYRDETGDGGTMSHVTLDGVAHPELNQRVAWLSPDEGYRAGY